MQRFEYTNTPRGAVVLRILASVLPHSARAHRAVASGAVPREPDVVEQRAFDRRQPDGQESQHEVAGEGEAQLGVHHSDLRPDELIESGAAGWAGGPRAGGGALVVDE